MNLETIMNDVLSFVIHATKEYGCIVTGEYTLTYQKKSGGILITPKKYQTTVELPEVT